MAMIKKPRRLEENSTIAVIAPAGPPDLERLRRGVQLFEKRGYKIRIFPQARRRLGYLAGDDKLRATALNQAFEDGSIDAIVCARGGYGTLRLLPYIDFNIIKNNPKIFIGYSDITVLLLAIFKKCNFVTFHGPMMAIEFGRKIRPYTENHFFDVLNGLSKEKIINISKGYRVKVLSGGIAEGRIVGGNLCLMTKLIGTGLLPIESTVIFRNYSRPPISAKPQGM
jgi:muramoyltetrapeptide carboxypeptidase